MASSDVLPFFAYFLTRFDLMMADVMEKFVAYAVFAAMLASIWTRVWRLDTGARALTLAATGVAVAIPLEIVQMFIPVRVPSLTDLILAGCGSVVGAIAQEKAVMFYCFARSRDAVRPEVRGRKPSTPADLAPTDVLVATLMDPHAGAPVEHVPTRRPRS